MTQFDHRRISILPAVNRYACPAEERKYVLCARLWGEPGERGRQPLRAQLRGWGLLLGVFAVLCGMACEAPSVRADDGKTLVWQYHVVGTPEFMGPPKIHEQGFAPPVPVEVATPKQCRCRGGRISGEFEAYISDSGRVETVHSHHEPVAGTACQKQCVLSVVSGWRFQPATFAGKPTPVYMWIGVDVEEE